MVSGCRTGWVTLRGETGYLRRLTASPHETLRTKKIGTLWWRHDRGGLNHVTQGNSASHTRGCDAPGRTHPSGVLVIKERLQSNHKKTTDKFKWKNVSQSNRSVLLIHIKVMEKNGTVSDWRRLRRPGHGTHCVVLE